MQRERDPGLFGSRQRSCGLTRGTRNLRESLDAHQSAVDVLHLAVERDNLRCPLLDASAGFTKPLLDDLDARQSVENFGDDAHSALRVFRDTLESWAYV